MNYQQTLDFLYSQLPMFQRIGPAAYKGSLNNTLALCDVLDNPQEQFKSIHIAGTNGKGSVSHLIASILQAKGLKTGLYTSPHLKDFRERIKINGKNIPRSFVTAFVEKFQDAFENIKPSFFEMTFGLAARYFAEEKVDLAVMETGMGGRLDSTNVINPTLSVITNISLDHTAFLGETIKKISVEKAGIIKAYTPVIIGETQEETEGIFENFAEVRHAPICFADQKYFAENTGVTGNQNAKLIMDIYRYEKLFILNLRCPLLGKYQYKNIICVMQIADDLIHLGYDIRKSHIVKGINDVIKNTGISGRWQILSRKPLTICDVGHNREGITQVTDQIRETKYNKLHFVFGSVADKDLDPILAILPKDASYYFCKANIPRGLDAEALRTKAVKYDLKGSAYDSVEKAYNVAKKNAKDDDLVFIGGSIFVVAEIL